MLQPTTAGFGVKNATLALYIANRPPIDDYPQLTELQALKDGEAHYIGQNTSNHWRKVFNVSAKFLFELRSDKSDFPFDTWQALRDQSLFQAQSDEALIFTPPDLTQPNRVHIICGKTYAQTLELGPLLWLDNHFAVSEQHPVIVCPYLDYRQLSNERITRLVGLVKSMQSR